MITRLSTAGLLAAALLVLSTPAAAQSGHDHDGFWGSAGLGGGWNTSEGLDDDQRGGGALYLRLGGTPDQQLLLGGEIIGWGREVGDATLTRSNATFTAQFYPIDRGGFFVKGGIGGANVEVSAESGGTTVTTSEQGFATTLGAGWDVRLSSNLYLTPNADFLFQAFDAGPNLTSTNTLFLLTVGLTWY